MIPEHLDGTPAGELLKAIHGDAIAVGVTIERQYVPHGYGDGCQVLYRAEWRGTELFYQRISGQEGKTARAQSWKTLEALRAAIVEKSGDILMGGMIPTVYFPGDFWLSDAQEKTLRELGAVHDWMNDRWVCADDNADQVRELLEARRYVSLGSLSRAQEAVIRFNIRDGDWLKHGSPGYEVWVLAKYEARVREAFARINERVSVGRDFPRQCNGWLKRLGGRWKPDPDPGEWTVPAEHAETARQVIQLVTDADNYDAVYDTISTLVRKHQGANETVHTSA